MRLRPLYVLLVILVLPAIAIAEPLRQRSTCPEIVERALSAAGNLCEATSRNEICYGNVSLTATAQADVSDFRFETVGDITSVVDLASLRINPLDEALNEWGIALMRLQANLPDTVPGQNVTFVLFGDVELVNNVSTEQIANGEFTPMQSFYLTTGIGDARCREAPESGMLVQTPEGVGEISLVVNEVNVQMGSTVLFQADAQNNLQLTTLEGAAVVDTEDTAYPVIAGTRFNLNVTQSVDGRRFIPLPDLPAAYELERLEALPVGLLDRRIELRQPLDKTALADLHERIETGVAACGEAPFPACDRLPSAAGGTPCVLPDAVTDENADQPLCEVADPQQTLDALVAETCNCRLRDDAEASSSDLPECDEFAILGLWSFLIGSSMVEATPPEITGDGLLVPPDLDVDLDMMIRERICPEG